MSIRNFNGVVALTLIATIGAGCGGGAGGSTIPGDASAAPANVPQPQQTATTSPANVSSTPYTCPNAQTSSGTLNCSALPLGDRKYSTTTAQAGSIFSCQTLNGTPPVTSAPWLNTTAGTWNLTQKIAVAGSVSWNGTFAATTSGATTTITSHAVPIAPHTTGIFPIQATDPAYQYDRNPNSIGTHAIDASLNANPVIASSPSCLGMGAIGITLTGVAIYNAFDAAGYDAVAREEQDACHGHPDQSDTYHYHGILQACVPDAGSPAQNSSLLGYALDGFGIYGPWYDGKVLTSADLDECHGTTSPVEWHGALVSIYHYVSTYDFPYTLGCYRGTPVGGL